MSEFREQWPQSNMMGDHQAHIQHGLEVIEHRLALPQDRRWAVAYGALVMGGLSGTVFSEGQPGTGKTSFGNIVFGEDMRVDIQSTDTVETLEGMEKPLTEGHQYTEPKLKLDEEDMRLFWNELSHLRDVGPLHKYWDGEELILHGRRYDLTNASIYATANFPDGGRSKPIGPATRSRFAVSALAGDGTLEHAKKVHVHHNGQPIDSAYQGGILPPAKERQRIREAMEKVAPVSEIASDYMVDVISSMNLSQLVQRPLDLQDKRTTNGWAHAARAARLVNGEGAIGGPITPEELARVASLGLGSVASLNSMLAQRIAEESGTFKLEDIQKAVYARRAIAAVAMHELIKTRDVAGVVSPQKEITQFMSKRSYASLPETADGDNVIVETLLYSNGNQGVKDAKEQPGGKRRRWSLRKSS